MPKPTQDQIDAVLKDEVKKATYKWNRPTQGELVAVLHVTLSEMFGWPVIVGMAKDNYGDNLVPYAYPLCMMPGEKAEEQNPS